MPTVNHDHYDDAYLRRILLETRTISVVGASSDPRRPSHEVMQFLQARGYRVVGVNPKVAASNGEILGERVHAALADVPEPFEMIDVFRKSEAAGGVVDEAIELASGPSARGIRTIWMQLGVRDDAAAARAEAAGLQVVMDRCPKIEWRRLRLDLG